MKIMNETDDNGVIIENGDTQQNESFVIVESGSCKLPAPVRDPALPGHGDETDDEYMSDVYNYPLRGDRKIKREDEKVIHMRVDIKMRIKSASGDDASAQWPHGRHCVGFVAPPSTPTNSMTNISAGNSILDAVDVEEDLNCDVISSEKPKLRYGSAPPAMSQYRARVLAGTTPWIRKRAINELAYTSTIIRQTRLLRDRPSTSVRPFSERDNNDIQNKVWPVRVQPPVHPSRISIPDFGSFRGKPPINAKYLRKLRAPSPATSKPYAERTVEDDIDTKSVVSSTETSTSTEKTHRTKIDQYISELRKSMKSTTLEQNHRRRLKTFSAWAVSNSCERPNSTHDKYDDSIGDSVSEFGIDLAKKSLLRDNKFQNQDVKRVRQEIMRQLTNTPTEENKEDERKNFLQVTGDTPPTNINIASVGPEPAIVGTPTTGLSVYNTRDFHPTKRKVSLSKAALHGKNRYAKQFGLKLAGREGYVRDDVIKSDRVGYYGNLGRVTLPNYVEFRVINKNLLREQRLPCLKLKFHSSQLLSNEEPYYRQGAHPFDRSLIGKPSS